MLILSLIIFMSVGQIDGRGRTNGFKFVTSTLIQDSIILLKNELTDYINAEVKMVHAGTPQASFNIESELIKELPNDFLIILQVDKFNPNRKIYEPTPISIEKTYCNYMKMDKIVYPIILKKGNFPSKCPVSPGLYYIRNFTVTAEDIPVSVPTGSYKLLFAFKYQGKKMEIIWKGRST